MSLPKEVSRNPKEVFAHVFLDGYEGTRPLRYILTGYNEKESGGAKLAWSVGYVFGGFALVPLKNTAKLIFQYLPYQAFTALRDLTKSLFKRAEEVAVPEEGALQKALAYTKIFCFRALGVLAAIPAGIMKIVEFLATTVLSPISAAKETYGDVKEKNDYLAAFLAGARFTLSLAMMIVGTIFAIPAILGGIAYFGNLASAVQGMEFLASLPIIAKLQSFLSLLTGAVQSLVAIATPAAVAGTAFWATVIATVGLVSKTLLDAFFKSKSINLNPSSGTASKTGGDSRYVREEGQQSSSVRAAAGLGSNKEPLLPQQPEDNFYNSASYASPFVPPKKAAGGSLPPAAVREESVSQEQPRSPVQKTA